MADSPRPKTIGILGGGQLGRMLALAGYTLGYRFRILDIASHTSTEHLAEFVVGSMDDIPLLERFAEDLAVVTYEFENMPASGVQALREYVSLYPPQIALEVSQDRLVEKSYLNHLGIRTAPFMQVSTLEDLNHAVGILGFPCVLKTRRMGYDGKGQVILRSGDQVVSAWQGIGTTALILEAYIPFETEVSLLAVRGIDAEQQYYPLVMNTHQGGILRQSIPIDFRTTIDEVTTLQKIAEGYANSILSDMNYVGVLAIEFFVMEGRLIANEIAPRVHNSGHWTIEGAETSQFENHIRAITGLPLGSTSLKGHSAMINIIGQSPDEAAVVSIPFAHLHLYDKAPRPERKLGHITINAPSIRERDIALEQVIRLI